MKKEALVSEAETLEGRQIGRTHLRVGPDFLQNKLLEVWKASYFNIELLADNVESL